MTSNGTTIDIKKYRDDLKAYTVGMILPRRELMDLDQETKLKILQVTPPSVVKSRKVGGKEIPYVEVGYIERALNFISSFRWGCKVQREGYKEYIRQKKNYKTGEMEDQKVFDAWVLADFRIEIDGYRIERSCYGMRQMFENPAISDYSALEASRSMATKSFADTLGIASDKLQAENKAFQEIRMDREQQTIEDITYGFSPIGENGKH